MKQETNEKQHFLIAWTFLSTKDLVIYQLFSPEATWRVGSLTSQIKVWFSFWPCSLNIFVAGRNWEKITHRPLYLNGGKGPEWGA